MEQLTCTDNLNRCSSILYVTGSMFDESSGPYLSLMQTAETLDKRGHGVTVVGTGSPGSGRPSHWPVEAMSFSRYGPYSLHFAPSLRRWLNSEPWRWDVASLESVWSYVNSLVAEQCRRNKTPFMITTHGNFNPVALNISSWKKWLARHTFMKPVFNHVTCYHALTEIEYRSLREYGIREPICIIGNGIVLPDLHNLPEPETLIPAECMGRRTCLYLGRLHPIKGVDRLLRAWVELQPETDWQLVIAGDGNAAYRAELEGIAGQARHRNVHFVNFVRGSVKSAWLRYADFYVLPSYSEAFPMAVLESFSHGTPAMMTTTCGLPEAANFGAALEVGSSESGIMDGLVKLMSLPQSKLQNMGSRALTFVRERYDWRIICDQLEAIYGWMRGVSRAPDCLHFN